MNGNVYIVTDCISQPLFLLEADNKLHLIDEVKGSMLQVFVNPFALYIMMKQNDKKKLYRITESKVKEVTEQF